MSEFRIICQGPNLERARVLGELGVNNKLTPLKSLWWPSAPLKQSFLYGISKKKATSNFAEFIDERIRPQ